MTSEIKIEGINELIDSFDELLEHVHPRVILNVIGDAMLEWVDDNFKKEGAEERWPPLSLNTIVGRRRNSSKPLQDTGNLKRSFKKEVYSRSVDVGTRNKLAEWHHEGVPASKFAGKLVPKSKKALAFNVFSPFGIPQAGTIGGNPKVIVAAVNNHPGIPRRPLLPSQKLAETIASRTARAMLDRVIEEEF